MQEKTKKEIGKYKEQKKKIKESMGQEKHRRIKGEKENYTINFNPNC